MNRKNRFQLLRRGALSALLLPLYSLNVFADGDFASSEIATGTKQLLSDVSGWLIGVGLTVGTLAAIYCLIRKSMADEVDGKMWNKRLVTAIICAVAVALVGGIISLISSYYGG